MDDPGLVQASAIQLISHMQFIANTTWKQRTAFSFGVFGFGSWKIMRSTNSIVSLERLEMKGLVSARYADPEFEPEADSRRYFTVTLSGERALAHARETSTVVARFLPDFA
jgi:hypothetical protein